MRIRIIGAGSIGLLLAGKLARSRAAEIEIVARTAEQAELLRSQGITIVGEEGAAANAARLQTGSMERQDVSGERPDWLFLTVKQQAVDQAMLRGLQAMQPPKEGLVCWQNGIGHLELLAGANIVPEFKLYAAVTTEGARRLHPTAVAHTGSGSTAIGAAAPSTDPSKSAADAEKKLISALAAAGFAAVVSKQIHTDIWHKLLINSAINPLTAILQVPNGQLLQLEAARALMERLIAETAEVAAAEGVVPPADMFGRIAEVCRKTAQNRSSMLQDLDNGRITENEWISGGILRLAERRHLSVPATETVYRLVQALEKRG